MSSSHALLEAANAGTARDVPRIEPGDWRDIGTFAWTFSAIAGRAMHTNPPNLFRTLGRHRRLFLGWLHFAGRMMPGGRLPRRETELVILRVAHLRACTYEFEHHVHLGARAGIDAGVVARIIAGPDGPDWSPRERTLLAATDMLIAAKDLDDEMWAAVREHLDEREAIELVLLVTHYDMLATTITSLRIQPDRVIEGP